MVQFHCHNGESYRDFVVKRSLPIPELHVHLVELEHTPSGAAVMHIIADDPENAFCLSFQTRPYNSNGVAHILEHTVLCGSEKYPVRDPFFSMTRRSLNTYMNALTGNDFTCYPAATQVEKDFYNLLDIYKDAVFHPKLNLLSFKQEGHRLEFADPKNPNSPLEFKGIVYNEMKGAMSSPTSRLLEAIGSMLYPDTTYGHNSGGNPADILSLTHEELLDFHRTYYHPSRCLFYFYGNLPIIKHLDYLADNVLKDVKRVDPLPPIPLQPRFKEPKKLECSYPAEPNDLPSTHTIMSVAWLTCHVLEQEELLALCLVDSILMDTDASPLKRRLLDSKLCKQVSMYIDTDNAEVPMGVIFKGCDVEKAQEIEDLLLNSLREIAKEGIEQSDIENVMHQLEFHRSEITGDGFPFGLTLFTRAALQRQHGAPPENGLMIHSLFDRIRKRLKEEPRFLEDTLTKYFIDNPHRVTVVMVPDPQLTAKEAEEERKALQSIEKDLTEVKKEEILKEAAALEAYQAEADEQDHDILPIVSIDDVPKYGRDFKIESFADGNLEIFHHEVFTNQIAYLDYSVPLCHLEEHELPVFRLLVSLFGQMGTKKYSFSQILEQLQAHTGGIGASSPIYYHVRDPHKIALQFCLRGKSLNRNLSKLGELLHELASGVNFNEKERLKEIILKQWSGLQSSLNNNAMRYASNLAAKGLDEVGQLQYQLYGMGYYYFIKEVAENIDANIDALIQQLMELQDKILHGNNAHLSISGDASVLHGLQHHNYYGLETLPKKVFNPWRGIQKGNLLSPQGRIITSPVAFTSAIIPTIPYSHTDAPAIRLSSFIMDNICLHPLIREQGGAYGGGTSCNLMSAHFAFYGYRDPNIFSTLKAFNTAVEQVASGDFDDNDLFEAKLEMIQGMDAPISPGSRADVAYTWWREAKPFALRQKFREKTLHLTKNDVINAVQQHVVPHMANASIAIFAGKELLENDNKILADNGYKVLEIHAI